MRIFLFATVFLQLFSIADTLAQNELREKLKLLENDDFSMVSKTQLYSEALQIVPQLDSLISFVAGQKGSSDATFEKNIKPYLDEKLRSYNMVRIDFSDDEEMIYESFVKILKWENTLESVQLYEDFIAKFYKDPLEVRSVLLALSYVKSAYLYINTKNDIAINSYVRNKLNEEFQLYDRVGWDVFALHPGAMLFWLAATWIWDYKEN